MLLYIIVNTVKVRAQLSIQNIKYAATHPYELKSVSKIHWSKVI